MRGLGRSGGRERWSDVRADTARRSGATRRSPTSRAGLPPRRPTGRCLIEGDRRVTRGRSWDGRAVAARGPSSSRRGLAARDVVSFHACRTWIEAAIIALCGAAVRALVLIRSAELPRVRACATILQDCGREMLFIPERFRNHDHRQDDRGASHADSTVRDVVVVRGRRIGDGLAASAVSSAPDGRASRDRPGGRDGR
jgi:hypothetical protein